jgi:flagellar biosynthesis component FlhA
MDYNIFGSLESSSRLVSGDAGFLMPILIAALVIVLGWLIAGSLRELTIRLFKTLKVNEALDVAGLDKLAERAGHKLDAWHP